MKFARSMAGRLWATMMALMGTILLLLWLFQVVFFKDAYLHRRQSDALRVGAGIVAQAVRAGDDDGDPTGVSGFGDPADGAGNVAAAPSVALDLSALAAPEQLYHVQYIVLGDGPDPLYATQPLPMAAQVLERCRALYPDVAASQGANVRLLHPQTGFTYQLTGRALGGDIALFALVPTADAAGIARVAQEQLLLLSGILVLLAGGAALLAARGFSAPIEEVQLAAERMENGDLDVHLDETGAWEIARLCGTINRLGVSLRQTEQLRSELVANVSHELRTPLSLIRGYAETVRDVSLQDPDKSRAQLDIIIEESERLRTMVDTILDFSRLQSGLLSPSPQFRDACALVRQSIERYRPEIERAGLSLVVHIESGYRMYIDPDMLLQAMYNLLNNAVNHTPIGGRIDVIAYPTERGLHIDVLDDGPGIPQADLEMIWERFYKAQTPTGRRKRGSGLGLSLVRGIAAAHGGTCGAENRPSGGAHFWMEFPFGGAG